jgi:N-6 DNA Methylase
MANKKPIIHSPAHKEPAREFSAAMEDLARREGLSTSRVVESWLELSFRALRGQLLRDEAFRENEAAYQAIIDRHRDPQKAERDFAAMLGVTIQALREEPSDFLGPIFEFHCANARMGQFFTPPALGDVLARMSLGNAKEALAKSEHGYLLCLEPACGTGGLVLSACKVLREQGLDPARHCHWVMIEIGFTPMCGAYIQAALTGVSAEVVHGNALTEERWLVTPTMEAIAYPKRRAPEPAAEPASAPPAQVPRLPAPDVPVGSQLPLFGEEAA